MMKNLLLKFGLFIVILLLIKIPFVVFFGDRFIYQNPAARQLGLQVQYRQNEFARQDYNAVFVGSSRTALGISPAYFDSLTGGKTNSYNFGIIGGTPPQTFDWCANLIKTKPSLKYVFFELSGTYSAPVSYNNWALTFFKPAVRPARMDENDFPDLKMPLQNIPLESFLNKKDAPAAQNFSLERVQLMQIRNQRAEQSNAAPATAINQDFSDRVAELIKLAEAKQIHIYFFIPPRLETENEFNVIYPVYSRLEDKYKLKAAHYDESLYQTDTSIDSGHLNYKGAKKFTELAAEAFNHQNF